MKPLQSALTADMPTGDQSQLSTMGRLFIAILLIVVFEGALRKWVSTDFTYPLLLLRDSLALYGVYWAFAHGKLNSLSHVTHGLVAWSMLVCIWGLLQFLVNETPPIIFIIGLRFWLLYLWFAYAAGMSLTEVDFDYITKVILLLLLGMVPLVVTQYYLSPSAFLNKQLDDDPDAVVFQVIAGVVRATGTFSFNSGYSDNFLAIVNPLVLNSLADFKSGQWRGKWFPYVLLFILAIGTIVSGSRAALIMFAGMFAVYAFVSLRYAKASQKGYMVFVLAFVSLLIAAVPYLFPSTVDVFQERFAEAAESENFFDRLTAMFIGEPSTFAQFSLLGSGIGIGSNFAGIFETGAGTFLLAETETARIFLEGGIIGLLFICLKVLVLVIGLRKAFSTANTSGKVLPLLLWGTLIIVFTTWPLTGQLTANALGWMLFGLGIASLRLSSYE